MIYSLGLNFTYLRKQKQNFRISNTHSSFEFKILGVPLRSIVRPILFNLSINNLIYITKKTSTFNFADNNTIHLFLKNDSRTSSYFSVGIFKIIILWFKENKMVVNEDKFQVLLIKRRKQYHTNKIVQIE